MNAMRALVVTLTLAICMMHCIYASLQSSSGVNDWSISNIGKSKSLWFHKDAVYVGSHSNVIGAVSVDDGQLLWRQVLKSDDTVHSVKGHPSLKALASLSGSETPTLRLWNLEEGSLIWESSAVSDPTQTFSHSTGDLLFLRRSLDGQSSRYSDYIWALLNNEIFVWEAKSGELAFQCNLDTRDMSDAVAMRLFFDKETQEVMAVGHSTAANSIIWWKLPWMTEGMAKPLSRTNFGSVPIQDFSILGDGRVVVVKDTKTMLVCSSGKETLISIKEFTQNAIDRISIDMADFQSYSFYLKLYFEDYVVSLVSFSPDSANRNLFSTHQMRIDAASSASMSSYRFNTKKDFVWALVEQKDETAKMTLFRHGHTTAHDTTALGEFEFDFSRKSSGAIEESILSRDSHGKVNLFLLANDDSFSMVSQEGYLMWSRDEALAEITDAHIVEIPSQSVAAFDGDDMFPGFVPRTIAQIEMICSSFYGFFTSFSNPSSVLESISDYFKSVGGGDGVHFGSNKILVALTRTSKVYGIDVADGSIVWSIYLESDIVYSGLLVAKSHSLHPLVVAVTENGLVYIDVRSGKIVKVLGSPGRFSHILALTRDHHDMEFIGISSEMHVKSFSDFKLKSPIYFQKVSMSENVINGYSLVPSDDDLAPVSIWSIPFINETIVSFLDSSLDSTTVQSLFQKTENSIRKKYINPNLITVATQSTYDNFLKIYMIDGVTGAIVHISKHQDSTGPVQMVRSENSLVYHFWNDMDKRYQISIIELFSKDMIVSHEFSSLDQSSSIQYEHQSFAFEMCSTTLGVTRTKRGVSSKSIIVGLCSGQLMSIGMNLLDPRRVMEARPPTPEEKASGIFPYETYLPSNRLNFISHSQKIERLSTIISTDTELESTSLVLAYGLDLFLTQMTPSQSFDYLNDDFNLPFLVLTVGGVFIATIVTSRMAKSKRLERAWK